MGFLYRFQSNYTVQELKCAIQRTASNYSIISNGNNKGKVFYKFKGAYVKFICFPENGDTRSILQFLGCLKAMENGSEIIGIFSIRSEIILFYVFSAIIIDVLIKNAGIAILVVAVSFILTCLNNLPSPDSRDRFLYYLQNNLLGQQEN